MKKYLLLTLCALLSLSQGVLAQPQMHVNMKNGSVMNVFVSEIDSITWDDPTDDPGENNPDDPTVTVKPEYVDLGLSVKWATFNVGATKPEEYGDYFAWGETEPYYEAGYAREEPQSHWKSGKSGYDWSTYKYCNGSVSTLTKYCTNSSYGTVDNKTVLDLGDDAAHVNWGGSWRMPTKAEQDELRDNCTWTWTTLNGVNGYKVVSKVNGNSIFLPASGFRDRSSLYVVGIYGYYWSSSLGEDTSDCAYYLYFGSSDVGWDDVGRNYGLSVRAVCP